MAANVVLLAGLGFGDEGKGTTIDWLARRHSSKLVVRYNGGGQCGHNVVLPDGRHHCFAQFGSGTFAGARTHLSRYMLANPVSMLSEGKRLETCCRVANPFDGVTIEDSALVTTPFHVAANRIREIGRSGGRHGSCGMGVGETMQDCLEESEAVVIRISDILDTRRLRMKLAAQQELKRTQLRSLVADWSGNEAVREQLETEWSVLGSLFDVNQTMDYFAEFAKRVTIVGQEWLTKELGKDQSILFEGAQGILLDQDFGFHPHTTWTNITFDNAQSLVAGHGCTVSRVGVVRAFQTRHGAGPFVTEDAEACWPLVSHDHNTWGPWQEGFRVGPLDLVATRYAIDVLGGVNGLVLTNVDRLGAISSIRSCFGYAAAVGHPDPELFDSSSDGIVRRIRVRHLGIEHQEKITRELNRLRPVFMHHSNESTFAFLVSEILGSPLMMISRGPTFEDKMARCETRRVAAQ